MIENLTFCPVSSYHPIQLATKQTPPPDSSDSDCASLTDVDQVQLSSSQTDQMLLAGIEERLRPFLESRGEDYPYDQADIEALENVLASWPDDDPLFDRLTSREAKIAFINYVVSVMDKTNNTEYISVDFNDPDTDSNNYICHDYSLQMYINLSQGEVDLSNSDEIFTGPTLPLKYRLPICIFSYHQFLPEGGIAHAINAVLVGTNENNMDDWYYFEPQTDYGWMGISHFGFSNSSISFYRPDRIDDRYYDRDNSGSHFFVKSPQEIFPLVSMGQGAILDFALLRDPAEFAETILNLQDSDPYSTANVIAAFELGVREGILSLDYLQDAVQAMHSGRRQRILAGFLEELAMQQAREAQLEEQAQLLAEIEEKLAPFLTSQGENYPYDRADVDALENVLASWPDDEPLFDHLTTREARTAFVNYVISIKDNTNEHEFFQSERHGDPDAPNEFNCIDFAFQTYINLTKSELNLSRLIDKYTEPTLTVKYRIPIHIFSICSSHQNLLHDMNAVLIGNDRNNLNDWYVIEPQSDIGYQGVQSVVPPDTLIDITAPIIINEADYDYYDPSFLHFYLKPNLEIIGPINRTQAYILYHVLHDDFQTFALRNSSDFYDEDHYSIANFKSAFELGIQEGLLTIDYLQSAVQAMQGGRRKRALTRFLRELASEVVNPTQSGQ